MKVTEFRRKMVISLLLGMVIFVAILMFSDVKEFKVALADFDLRYLPLIICVLPVNYISRFVKYNYYLNVLGVEAALNDRILIQISSCAMTITPGKLGELFVKSYLLHQNYGTPYTVTVPLTVVERLTDGLGMILLAFVGFSSFHYGESFLLIVTCILFIGILVIQNRKFCNRILQLATQIKFIKKRIVALENFYNSAYSVLRLKPLLIGILTGVVSWTCEGIVVYLSMYAFHEPIPLLRAIFVVAFSAILGGISMLPGGLVAIDGTILGLLVLMGYSRSVSGAATLLSRFSTLWLGVIVGMIALFIMERRGMFEKKETRENLT